MKAALYLFGHGPYRKPRIIEMQYLRAIRYSNALEKKLEKKIDIKGTYIDINFRRKNDLGRLSNLQVLLKRIKKREIDTVIVDICCGDSYSPDKYTPIIWAMEKAGAEVYNCYYDDEDAMLSLLIESYGEGVYSYMIPDDHEEFIELFPALASKICYEVLENGLSGIPANNTDPFVNYVYRRIDSLRNKNPYSRSSLPWLSCKKISSLSKLKREELDKRKITEDTYIFGPKQAGKLFDEDVSNLRCPENYDWVLYRLKDLGFHHYAEEKRHAFIREYKDYLIYADPREKGSIEMFIYTKEGMRGTVKGGGGVANIWLAGLRYLIIGK